MSRVILAKDVLEALDRITGGRVVTSLEDLGSGKNPFVLTKSSHIPGKAVTELPGLVCGSPDHPIKKIAVLMTLTESAIELAGATGVDAVLAHHPIADASNSGGVVLRNYLNLYRIAAFELHEAFHGLHPGIAFLHGHLPYHVDIKYGDIPGNVIYVGEALSGVKTVGDIISRLNNFMDKEREEKALRNDRELRGCPYIEETSVCASARIVVGKPENPVKNILHIFPHTGFTPAHLKKALEEYPGMDTIIASISGAYFGTHLVKKAEKLGLNFICGNSHALEIFENGLPLARALKMCLSELEVVIFRERMSSIPLGSFGSPAIQVYANEMAVSYLVTEEKATK